VSRWCARQLLRLRLLLLLLLLAAQPLLLLLLLEGVTGAHG
jgi:hypothetical protein